MRCDVGARFVQMHMLIDMIDSGHPNEMMVLPVRRALLGELDFVVPIEVVDLAHCLPIGRNDVHVLFDLRCIGHAKPPENAPGTNAVQGRKLQFRRGAKRPMMYRRTALDVARARGLLGTATSPTLRNSSAESSAHFVHARGASQHRRESADAPQSSSEASGRAGYFSWQQRNVAVYFKIR